MNSLNNHKAQHQYGFAALVCLFTAFFLIFLSTKSAYAESKQCRALRSQLTNLNVLRTSSAPQSATFKRFDSLSKRQAAALKNAHRDAFSLRCISRSGKRTGQGAASCPALLNKIGKMQKNLKKLTAKRNKAQPKKTRSASDIRRQKRAIRAKIQKLRCGSIQRQASDRRTDAPKTQTKKAHKPNLLSRLFGSPSRRQRAQEQRLQQERIARLQEKTETKKRSYGNVFRTLCVRVCDGYYFPVNFATVRQSFDADQAFCQASNPNTEMRLFFYRNPSEDSQDMRDLAGRLYTELPNAFRYRREVVNNQICPHKPIQSAFKQIAGSALGETLSQTQRQPGALRADVENAVNKPSPKPNIFSDADTHMALVGRFKLQPVSKKQKPVAAPNPVTTYDPAKIAGTGVRVIGPTFLDDRQSVELLLAPDQIQVQ